MRREPVRVEHRAHPLHQRQPLVDLLDRGRRERAVGPLVVPERGLPLPAVVVDLAEREVEVALHVRVRRGVCRHGTDAVGVLVLVRPGREALRLREVERGLGEARIQGEGRAIVPAGGVEVAGGGMDDAGVVQDLGRAGVELERAGRLRQRLLLLAVLDESAGEPRPHLGVVRRERRRLAQEVLGADQVVHVQQCPPEVEVGGRVARIVGEGGLVAGDGRVPLVAFLQQIAEAVVGDGDGRVPAEQAAVQVDGEVGAAALARGGGEQVQGVGLVRRRVEHPPGEASPPRAGSRRGGRRTRPSATDRGGHRRGPAPCRAGVRPFVVCPCRGSAGIRNRPANAGG